MAPSGGLGFRGQSGNRRGGVADVDPAGGRCLFPANCAELVRRLPWLTSYGPAILCVPYYGNGVAREFRWGWFALYALLPVAVAILLWQAARMDQAQRGNWRDFLVLAALGLAVDLRWFEPAWPEHLAAFGKMLLLDAGIYGFILVRQLDGVGFDLRLRLRDSDHRAARIRVVCADCDCAWPGTGVSPSPCRLAAASRAGGALFLRSP